MKIFGREFGNVATPAAPATVETQIPVVKDERPEIELALPDTKKPALIPKQSNPVLHYHQERLIGRGAFTSAEYDLAEVGRIEDTDSYVRQAFDKKVALMFKEGWGFTGANPRTVKYIKARFAQIERASNTPTDQLLRAIGSELIRKSNVFIIKVRNSKASGGQVRTEINKKGKLQPVAAYFIAPAETMNFQMNNGQIVLWRQKMPGGEYRDFSVADVIHLHYDRKEGFVFGTPTLIPVIDDIRALRKIEENIELLVYQHLFPLFQYKVGTKESPAGMTETGEREIDVVRREIQYMPTEGGIVTPERHEIVAIGAEGRALRAEGFLEHFKKRVLSGLGISAVDVGEGNTANRATADNMSRNLVDGVKDFQQIMMSFFSHEIINELLLESTFGLDVLDPENQVKLFFKEIDIDAQVKKEAHYADQFAKDMITLDEARIAQGREPILIPSAEEVESGSDTPDKFPDWNRMRWKLFQLPTLLIQAIDEPWSPAAKASAKLNASPVTQGDLDASSEEKIDHEMELEKEKTKAKVAVAKAKPKPVVRKDSALVSTFEQTKLNTITYIEQKGKFTADWITSLIRTQMQPTIKSLVIDQIIAYRNGYSRNASVHTEQFAGNVAFARRVLTERANKYINRVTENVISSMRRNIKPDMSLDEVKATTKSIFESVSFRTQYIEDVEIKKAYNYGLAISARSKGKKGMHTVHTKETDCATCNSKHEQVVDLANVTLEDVAPHHANCGCAIMFFDTILENTNDSGMINNTKGNK